MSHKRTLHDIITLFLAARPGEWTPSFKLSKQDTQWGFIGSSGERRARELAEDGTHTVGNTVFVIERRTNGKYAEYRVASSGPKQPKFRYVQQPDGSVLELPFQ